MYHSPIAQSLCRPVPGVKVTKNRFDGDLGRVPLVFEKNSLTFSGLHLRQRKREGVASGSGDHAPPALRVVSDLEGAQMSHAPFSESHTHTPIGATLKSVAETESSAGLVFRIATLKIVLIYILTHCPC